MKKILGILLSVILAAGVLTACGSNGSSDSKGTIKVGGKGFTEGYILSEIYALALEDNGYKVERTYDMNTDVIAPAIEKGEIDMYPEYVGTALTDVLGDDMETDLDKAYKTVSDQYAEKWDIKWLKLTKMEDKVAIVMRADKAKELGVKNLSDLQKVSGQLVLGDGVNFAEREDDLLRLDKIYGKFNFTVKNIDASLAYDSLDDGSVDVIPGLTTDPQLLSDKYVVIKEDIPVWPPQYVAPIVRQEVLDKNPGMEKILNSVSSKITTKEMIKMLDKVVNDGDEYEDVAKEFYEENCK